MEQRVHLVDFEKWCKTCKHHDKPENESPCWECLDEPTNIDSRKPILWTKNPDTE